MIPTEGTLEIILIPFHRLVLFRLPSLAAGLVLGVGACSGKGDPNCEIDCADGAGPDTRCYRVNFDKIHRVFPDFRTKWNAKKGVEQCYESYLKHGLNKDDYEGIKYKRIAHIKKLIADGKLNSELRWQV